MEPPCISAPSAPTARRRWLRWVRLVAGAAGWLLAIALVLPVDLGGRVSWVGVAGHSMEPTYHTYDLALAVRTGTAEVGDVIVYRVPEGEPGEGHQVIHRIIGGDAAHGYTTKGDNREGPDIWHPRNRDVVGRVVVVIPQGGKVLAVLLNPHNVGLVGLGLLIWALWPRADEPSGDAVGHSSDTTADEAPQELVDA